MNPVLRGLIFLAVLAPSVILHEVSHGVVAERFGDSTARRQGRITLNPLVHIDPIGTVVLPAILALTGAPVFGWAKPVPVVPGNLRKPTIDMAIVALAGPLTNFALAMIAGRLLLPLTAGWVAVVLWAFAYVNVILAAFNLLPVPPLDGSRVLPVVFGDTGRKILTAIEPYGMLLVFGILLVPALSAFFLAPIGWFARVAGLA